MWFRRRVVFCRSGRSGGGRLERLAHVLKLADRHVDGNVENVDGEALQSAERVVETLKEKKGSMGHRCWVHAVVLCPMYISILEAVLPISTEGNFARVNHQLQLCDESMNLD